VRRRKKKKGQIHVGQACLVLNKLRKLGVRGLSRSLRLLTRASGTSTRTSQSSAEPRLTSVDLTLFGTCTR
jgi:hypothetical protein